MSAPTEQEVVSGFAVWASRNGWHQDETGVWFRIQWGAPHTEPVGQLQGECLLEQCRVLLAESWVHRLPTERLAWLFTHEQANLLRMWRPHNGSYPPCTMDPGTMAITLFGLPITRGGDRFGLVVMPVEPKMTNMPILTCARCGAARGSWNVFETGWPDNIRYWCIGEQDHRPWWVRWGLPRRLYRWFA